ncbi:PREDICTED: beta-adducin, partial [Tinamus guttatus]|uniref:beta-adducin n=1 Tax=Tinamus guttatus TaxID=94827 RepID=UPI00052E75EA
GGALPLAKGERLMRCKVGSVYRLLDLYGWAQLSDTYVTLRVSKEQDHFLISPKGLSCSEVTASSLILVLRNHGVLALGDTVEEAFYKIFHLQAACEIQVSALSSAGGAENLIVLQRDKHRPHEAGSVRWAGSTFGPMQKSRLGEHEFEALMRMLDNLGYRTGYTYRYPFVQEKSKPKSDVLIPATVTAFVLAEEAAVAAAPRQHAQRQQQEKMRWSP